MNDFCDFDKPRKRVYQKEMIESNEQSKEGDRPKYLPNRRKEMQSPRTFEEVEKKIYVRARKVL